jgi:hypothetical protein
VGTHTPWARSRHCDAPFVAALDRNRHDFAMAIVYEVARRGWKALGEAEEAVALAEYYCDQSRAASGMS